MFNSVNRDSFNLIIYLKYNTIFRNGFGNHYRQLAFEHQPAAVHIAIEQYDKVPFELLYQEGYRGLSMLTV